MRLVAITCRCGAGAEDIEDTPVDADAAVAANPGMATCKGALMVPITRLADITSGWAADADSRAPISAGSASFATGEICAEIGM